LSGRNSAVECQLPKLDVVGSTPIARSNLFYFPLRLFQINTMALHRAFIAIAFIKIPAQLILQSIPDFLGLYSPFLLL
jgi:hypothetical protein